MKKQLRKPDYWQDFEDLCKRLWGEMYDCSNTIKKHGRIGQAQQGVDVYFCPKDGIEYYGIQCKGKDEYTHSNLTVKEIDEEIIKAKEFKPALKHFYFATTANKDSKIEEYIRFKNVESRKQGGFNIDVFSWEDIVDKLDENKSTHDWYEKNSQYKVTFDFEVTIDGKQGCIIHPEYYRVTQKNILRQRTNLLNQDWIRNIEVPEHNFIGLNQIINPPRNIDYRWCDVNICFGNTGNTNIEDYKLSLLFEAGAIESVSDKFRTINPFLMDAAAVAKINSDMQAEREVFKSSEYSNVIEYKPCNNLALVPQETKKFKVGVKPKDNISEINIWWRLISRDGNNVSGELKLIVEPAFEDKTIDIYVNNESEIKNDEVIISPKIVNE